MTPASRLRFRAARGRPRSSRDGGSAPAGRSPGLPGRYARPSSPERDRRRRGHHRPGQRDAETPTTIRPIAREDRRQLGAADCESRRTCRARRASVTLTSSRQVCHASSGGSRPIARRAAEGLPRGGLRTIGRSVLEPTEPSADAGRRCRSTTRPPADAVTRALTGRSQSGARSRPVRRQPDLARRLRCARPEPAPEPPVVELDAMDQRAGRRGDEEVRHSSGSSRCGRRDTRAAWYVWLDGAAYLSDRPKASSLTPISRTARRCACRPQQGQPCTGSIELGARRRRGSTRPIDDWEPVDCGAGQGSAQPVRLRTAPDRWAADPAVAVYRLSPDRAARRGSRSRTPTSVTGPCRCRRPATPLGRRRRSCTGAAARAARSPDRDPSCGTARRPAARPAARVTGCDGPSAIGHDLAGHVDERGREPPLASTRPNSADGRPMSTPCSIAYAVSPSPAASPGRRPGRGRVRRRPSRSPGPRGCRSRGRRRATEPTRLRPRRRRRRRTHRCRRPGRAGRTGRGPSRPARGRRVAIGRRPRVDDGQVSQVSPQPAA